MVRVFKRLFDSQFRMEFLALVLINLHGTVALLCSDRVLPEGKCVGKTEQWEGCDVLELRSSFLL